MRTLSAPTLRRHALFAVASSARLTRRLRPWLLALALSSPALDLAADEASTHAALLIRAVGPTLASFNVTHPFSDPVLSLYTGSREFARNDNWSDTEATAIAAHAARLGGFPLPEGSRDAALLATLTPGAYTAHVRGAAPDRGVTLLELYRTPESTARLVNLAGRANVGLGESILVLGFSLVGETARTLLIRAVGPGLRPHGVVSVLPDPLLLLFEGQTVLLTNNDWGDSSAGEAVRQAAVGVGAFPLEADSADAALLVTLMPGTYTVHARGQGGATGEVLLEVYAIP